MLLGILLHFKPIMKVNEFIISKNELFVKFQLFFSLSSSFK